MNSSTCSNPEVPDKLPHEAIEKMHRATAALKASGAAFA